MNETIAFLENFFVAECEARDAHRSTDNQDFNEKLGRMNEFATPSLQNAFGMIPRNPSYEYEGRISTSKTAKRHLFRIDRWTHDSYGELYGAYVSAVGGYGDRIYFELFFVAMVEGNRKIVRRYFLDKVGDGKTRWQMSGGDESIELSKLGKPAEILRLLAPDQDVRGDSMERYLKD